MSGGMLVPLRSLKRLALLFAILLVGCSRNDQPVTYPVAGKVLFRDGKAAKGTTVTFRTTQRVPAFMASGKTDDQGQFNFSAAEGENAVIVVPSYPRDTDEMTPAQRYRAMNPIDPMFLDFEQSKLKFEVTPDAAKNQFEIKVWPPKG